MAKLNTTSSENTPKNAKKSTTYWKPKEYHIPKYNLNAGPIFYI